MYKYSWKTALMTLGMTMVGQSVLAAASNGKDKALEDFSKHGSVKEDATAVGSDAVDSLQNKVGELSGQVDKLNGKMEAAEQAVNNLPPDLTFVVIGLVVIALVMTFLIAVLWRKVSMDSKRFSDLREELDHHKRLLTGLKNRIEEMAEASARTTITRERYPERDAYKPIVSPVRQEPVAIRADDEAAAVPAVPEPKPDIRTLLNEKCREFAREYNRIQSLTGFEAKAAKQEFQQKYELCGFVCANADERINHPEKPPRFKASESMVDASIWGFKFEAYYLVAPAPRQYVGNDHDYGGMKELFESNFQTGCIYNKIEVNKPAILTQDLQFIRWQGKLNLS